MGLMGMTEVYLDRLIREIHGDDVRRDDQGVWWLPGSGSGSVRLRGGSEDVFVEVAHVAANDVHLNGEVVDAVSRRTADTPVGSVFIGDTLIARQVLHAHDLDTGSLRRAIWWTWQLSDGLCDDVVGHLAAGSCPDRQRGPDAQLTLDLSGDADDHTPGRTVSTGDSAIPAGVVGAAGYL